MDIPSSNHSSSDWHIFIFSLATSQFPWQVPSLFTSRMWLFLMTLFWATSFSFPTMNNPVHSCGLLSAGNSWIYIKTQFLSSRVTETLPTWYLHLRCLLGILHATSKIEVYYLLPPPNPPLQKNPFLLLAFPNFISLTLQLSVGQPRNLDSLWIFLPDPNQ